MEGMKRMDLAGLALEAGSGAPIVVLREQEEPHRILPIFVGAPEAAAIALAVNGQVAERPMTHDLMAALVERLDGHVDSVEVTDLTEGTYTATLALTGPAGAQRVDTRPSDAIALAVRFDAPLYVSDAVLDEAGSVPVEEDDQPVLDEGEIDDAVDEFRSFLDDVDPAQFSLEDGGDGA
jgi:bifunctional DNase/RNase